MQGRLFLFSLEHVSDDPRSWCEYSYSAVRSGSNSPDADPDTKWPHIVVLSLDACFLFIREVLISSNTGNSHFLLA